jgi:queuine tRNA-ribosyltransferase/7-cyano-7-deazaguanine tRNA-ribosyltransferase
MKFTITAEQQNARTGVLSLKHGKIETPAFAPCATKGIVKLMDFNDMEKINAQVLMANTYHLYLKPGVDIIQKLGGINKFTNWKKPFMTDSGGFQAFSLGKGALLGKNKFGYFSKPQEKMNSKNKTENINAKIDDKGITFKSVYDGSLHKFTPEKTIKLQEKLGADMIFALDECTYPCASYEYTKQSMERTHAWAEKCVKTHSKKKEQLMFGIIQGGLFKDLRIDSAKTISSMDFEGMAIGGAFGKNQMYTVLDWVMPLLPKNKPRHLLGVGTVADIFESVKRGIDMFDCVGPQRIGRAGYFYISPESGGNVKNKFRMHITSSKFKTDRKPLDKKCGCKVCETYSRAFINHLFKAEPLTGMRLVSYHNIYFIVNLMKKIRCAINKKRFDKLYLEWKD